MVLDPSVVAPSLKVTVPEAEVLLIVAVNVTDCPTLDGFGDEVKLVDVTRL